MMKFTKLAIGLFILSMATSVWAEEKTSPSAADAAMQEMMKISTPGEEHKVLEPLIGTWKNVFKGRMSPNEKIEESKGTSEHTWMYDGRYVKADFKGNWAGQPFEGIDFIGYDKMKGEYQLVSLNNMSTSLMQASGSYDKNSKTLKLGGMFSCPLTGEKEKWFRAEWKIINKDKNIYTSYFKDKEGKEFKSAEINYSRIKEPGKLGRNTNE